MRILYAAFAACLAGPVSGSTIYYYDIIARAESGTFQNSSLEKSINNFGTVASDYSDSSSFPNPNGLVAIDISNDTRFLVGPTTVTSYRPPAINDFDQVATSRVVRTEDGRVQQLLRIETDGSLTVLAERNIDSPEAGDFRAIDGERPNMNDHGDVVAAVTTLDGHLQIVKFPGGGGERVTIVSTDTFEGGFSGTPQIDNDGTVSFFSFGGPEGAGIYTSDGSGAPELAVQGGGSSVFDRDDAGNVTFAGAHGAEGTAIYRWNAGDDPSEVTLLYEVPDEASVTGLFVNNAGSVAYTADQVLYIDGERLLGPGDTFADGLEVKQGASGPSTGVTFNSRQAFNEQGQLVVRVAVSTGDGPFDAQAQIVRISPEGTVLENPLLPVETIDGGDGRVRNIIDIVAPELPVPPAAGIETRPARNPWVMVDPIVATAFNYSIEDDASLFQALLFPSELELADDLFTIVFEAAGDMFEVALGRGEVLDFRDYDPLGIAGFTIGDIDPAAGADPELPFTVGISFMSAFSGRLFIDAETTDTDLAGVIPLPAGFPLLLAGLGALALIRRRQ